MVFSETITLYNSYLLLDIFSPLKHFNCKPGSFPVGIDLLIFLYFYHQFSTSKILQMFQKPLTYFHQSCTHFGNISYFLSFLLTWFLFIQAVIIKVRLEMLLLPYCCALKDTGLLGRCSSSGQHTWSVWGACWRG